MNTEDLHRNMIAFGEWLLNSSYYQYQSDEYTKPVWTKLNDTNWTTEELFQIYLKTLNNE